MATSNGKIEAIILAGGKGTRLHPVVADVPKALAPIGGVPFLDIILARLERSGLIGKVVLAVGHKAEMIIDRYKIPHAYSFEIEFSVERELLGTGGAIKQASALTTTDPVLVCNGDTFVGVNLKRLLAAHFKKAAPLTVVVKRVDEITRFGSIVLGKDSSITSFSEKAKRLPQGGGWINAGLYALSAPLLGLLAEGVSSFERDYLPLFASRGLVYGYPTRGKFLDIGIPESYAAAELYLARTLQPSRKAGK